MQQVERKAFGKQFEGIAVGAESDGACERDVAGVFPTAVETVQQALHAAALVGKPLEDERLHPFRHIETCHFAYHLAAWQFHGGIHERGIAVGDFCGAFHHHLRDALAVGAHHRSVVFCHDVQHNGIVCRIVVVPMAVPVGGAIVDFHVSRPQTAVNLHLGIEEVGTGVCVAPARVDDTHTASVVGGELARAPQTVFPHILHQHFHGKSRLSVYSQPLSRYQRMVSSRP